MKSLYGGGACTVRGCNADARPGELMCRRHWLKTPAANRRAVWSTLRAYERNKIDLEQLREVQDAACEAAASAA